MIRVVAEDPSGAMRLLGEYPCVGAARAAHPDAEGVWFINTNTGEIT